MRWMVVLSVLLMSLSATARTRTLRVFDVDAPAGADVMVKAETGEVLWVRAEDRRLQETIRRAVETGTPVTVETSETEFIRWAAPGAPEALDAAAPDELRVDKAQFIPTVFATYEDLRRAFLTMRRDSRKKSQCYERAYVWAYDLWETQGVSSMKLFLFFTDKYIRDYRYNWWFHVAPLSYVGDDEYVLDRRFARRPLAPRPWTNIFMRNNALCKSVESYFDYFKDDPTESCFLIRSSMYYLGPNALRRRDQGVELRKWNTTTLRTSRARGFW